MFIILPDHLRAVNIDMVNEINVEKTSSEYLLTITVKGHPNRSEIIYMTKDIETVKDMLVRIASGVHGAYLIL